MVGEQQFGGELAAGRLSFVSVSYDLTENKHFLTACSPPCPSLVLVCQRIGRSETWKLLNNTWQLVHEPTKFNGYLEAKLLDFLNQAEQSGHRIEAGLRAAIDGH